MAAAYARRAGGAALVAAGVGLAGCAPWLERPFAGLRKQRAAPRPDLVVLAPYERPIACAMPADPRRMAPARRRAAVAIGSVRFPGLGLYHRPRRFAPGAPALTVPMIVPPRSRAIVAVPVADRAVAGLDNDATPAGTPAGAHRAVRCITGERAQAFAISFVVVGARCLPVSVTIDRVTTTREVAFGVRRCRR
jgi:hypothetical protein